MVKSGTSNRKGMGSRASAETHSRDLTMRVAFQGDRGAYAESAIAQIWRHRVEQIPVPTFAGAVRAIQEGDADACVLPLENSIIGRVDPGWHALAASPDLRTVAETFVPVRHCLLAP